MEPTLETMVRELYDKQKIREVVTRYCRGVDRMDRDLFLSAYHPDAIDDHGFVVAGPAAFWAWVHHYHTTAQSTHPHIINSEQRRGGKRVVSTGRFRGAPMHSK